MTWLKVRFKTAEEDYRPIYEPPAHPVGPWWCSGYDADDRAIIIAYVHTLDELRRQWPEAADIEEPQERDDIVFTDRFPRPDWWPQEPHP